MFLSLLPFQYENNCFKISYFLCKHNIFESRRSKQTKDQPFLTLVRDREREREREIIEKSWTMRCVSDRRNRKAGWMLKKLIFILSLNKLFYMCYTKWEHSNFRMSYCCKYYQFDWVNNLEILKLYHKYVNTYIGLCYQQFEYTYNSFITIRMQYNGYHWYILAKGSANQIAM